MIRPDQEREYIRQARTDPSAFGPLYDHYFPRVHAYVRYRVYNPQDAEDVIADVFFKALESLKGFEWRNDLSFAAWLFRIAHNLVVDYGRRRTRAGPSLDSENALPALVDQAPLPEEALARRERFQQMRALIATLSPRRQEVVTLRFYAGLRNREIARVLGLGERTVAAHLSRALRDLESRYAVLNPLEMAMEAEK